MKGPPSGSSVEEAPRWILIARKAARGYATSGYLPEAAVRAASGTKY